MSFISNIKIPNIAIVDGVPYPKSMVAAVLLLKKKTGVSV
jgi:hypothetical protein